MTEKDVSRYAQRGVSSGKSEVQAAVTNLDKGIFPGAFCTVLPDVLSNSSDICCIQHADGAGTKAGLAYLAWKATGDIDVWKGIIWDSLVMNWDDVGCVGGLGPFLVSLIIGRNAKLIPGGVIKVLIEECRRACSVLSGLDIPCYFSGGETADLGDLIRTITVDNVVTTRMMRRHVIDASRICAPAFIVGFSSTGQAKWEEVPNSGMGSNGLTNARHDVLCPEYRRFHETYAPETDPGLIYCGDHRLSELLPGDERFTVGSALLSPTRTYLPLICRLVQAIDFRQLLGLIHCSGGGQTKIRKFGSPGIKYLKDNLFPIPPLFQFLQAARELPPREMYQAYNMGHRLEAVVAAKSAAYECIAVARDCGIDARIVGEVVPFSDNPKGRRVEIVAQGEHLTYDSEV